MKKIVLLLLLIISCFTGFNQVIKGTVLDENTKNAVCFATVYFNGTFLGTTADQDGNFALSITKNNLMPITISAIGYYSATINNYKTEKQLTIYLKPKVYDIQEVKVSTKSLERKRKRNLALFREEFLGTTDNASACNILNENDITFNYYSDEDTIKAFASKPIIVENKALGYKITYYLDKFEYYKKNDATFFCGNIIFNEDLSADNSKKQEYLRKRETTYQGSRMHFFRTLWKNEIDWSNFEIKNRQDNDIKYKDIVTEDDNGNKFISYKEDLIIKYNTRISYIIFLKEHIYFDQTGFFNPGINWIGEMSKQRIADWLPYEYSSDY